MAKTEPSRCNLTALRKATRRVSHLYDQVLATSGLRGTQRAILVYVRRSGAPTMGELAAALVLDRTALNHNLKPLERDGLLTITVDKSDRAQPAGAAHQARRSQARGITGRMAQGAGALRDRLRRKAGRRSPADARTDCLARV
ncbi:putative ArsR family transcriptional regulator [Bradyrhizobium sp. USDA 4519]